MRRPKAAIPILPPPENQQHQTSRGRGRSTQPQQNNQVGNIQQTEHEIKTDLEESDQKIVSEQFDNIQTEQITEVEEAPKNDDLSAITDTMVENKEKDVPDVDIDIPVGSEGVTTDQVDGISDHDSLKVTIDDQNIIPLKSSEAVVEETENDSNKIETTASESKVVEEAAA